MVDLIINGIANKLYELFEYKIHKDSIKQGLKPPCFLINFVTNSRIQELHNRELRRNTFIINYYPKTKDNKELYDVSEQLMQGMTMISVKGFGRLHGTDISSEIVDGVLRFQVNYNIGLRKNTATGDELMESMNTKGGVIG